jgi:hypothetical protein
MMMRPLPINACALLLTLAPALYAQAPAASEPADPSRESAPTTPASKGAAAPAPAPTAKGTAAATRASADAPTAATPPEATTAPAATAAATTAPASTASATTAPAATTPAPLTRPTLAASAPRARIAAAAAGPSAPVPPAAPEATTVELDDGPPVEAAPLPTVSAWLGFGSLWVPSQGLDPFAEDDALLLFSAGAALSLAPAGALDVAAVAGWDITSSDETYRGEPTSLGLMRFALGPELRGTLVDRLFLHGRLSPTLTRLSVELDESSSGATLAQSRWLFGAEAAVGLDFRFAQARASATRAVGIFARVEAGYAWSPSSDLSLEPSGSGAPVRTAPLELGDLALAGPTFKASLGAGF